jgi:hypothetical protein
MLGFHAAIFTRIRDHFKVREIGREKQKQKDTKEQGK